MSLFIGLMSGTSLDGVDGVLASFPDHDQDSSLNIIGNVYIPFPNNFRQELMSLQISGLNEIERESIAANQLASFYAECVDHLLEQTGTLANEVIAIGAHGQTIRHRPDLGFTKQINNAALLAELTQINVIADFRSRDIAAGGQGAPLVPVFHQCIFGNSSINRTIINIGGIANISLLNSDGTISGFDTGPGNMIIDAWIGLHEKKAYDEGGLWAKSGKTSFELLNAMLDEPFFKQSPPKSTGRDLFHLDWLNSKLSQSNFSQLSPKDVQSTLTTLTAITIADALSRYAPDTEQAYICGGGSKNHYLMKLLKQYFQEKDIQATLTSSDALGINPMLVESLAFAWLAYRFINRLPANLSSVTGASGSRILGALYPA